MRRTSRTTTWPVTATTAMDNRRPSSTSTRCPLPLLSSRTTTTHHHRQQQQQQQQEAEQEAERPRETDSPMLVACQAGHWRRAVGRSAGEAGSGTAEGSSGTECVEAIGSVEWCRRRGAEEVGTWPRWLC